MPDFAVILPAAGSSTRFGGSTSKLFQCIAGKPVLLHSLDAFRCRADVRDIIIPTRPDDESASRIPAELHALNGLNDDRIRFCAGGFCRAQSVWNAAKQVPDSIEWVAVHDAARPLISQALIDRTFIAAVKYGAAVPAMAISSTLKQADGPLPAKVQRTVPRHQFWSVQTPQIMRRRDLLDSFNRCPLPLDQITDDVQLLELAETDVWLVAGEESNLKITTPNDLLVANMHWQHR